MLRDIVASCASISWIDPRAQIPERDMAAPPVATSEAFIKGRAGYRFANFLSVRVQYDGQKILRHKVLSGLGGGLIMTARSALGVAPAGYPTLQRVTDDGSSLTVAQIVGCRTKSSEDVGGMVGSLGGGVVGMLAGRAIAHTALTFPPIWTELVLTIAADGAVDFMPGKHSLFPSNAFYYCDPRDPHGGGSYTQVSSYDAVPAMEQWRRIGWGGMQQVNTSGPTAGNPWNVRP